MEGDNQQRAEGTEQDTRLLHGATWEENVLMKWQAMERLEVRYLDELATVEEALLFGGVEEGVARKQRDEVSEKLRRVRIEKDEIMLQVQLRKESLEEQNPQTVPEPVPRVEVPSTPFTPLQQGTNTRRVDDVEREHLSHNLFGRDVGYNQGNSVELKRNRKDFEVMPESERFSGRDETPNKWVEQFETWCGYMKVQRNDFLPCFLSCLKGEARAHFLSVRPTTYELAVEELYLKYNNDEVKNRRLQKFEKMEFVDNTEITKFVREAHDLVRGNQDVSFELFKKKILAKLPKDEVWRLQDSRWMRASDLRELIWVTAEVDRRSEGARVEKREDESKKEVVAVIGEKKVTFEGGKSREIRSPGPSRWRENSPSYRQGEGYNRYRDERTDYNGNRYGEERTGYNRYNQERDRRGDDWRRERSRSPGYARSDYGGRDRRGPDWRREENRSLGYARYGYDGRDRRGEELRERSRSPGYPNRYSNSYDRRSRSMSRDGRDGEQ